MRLKCFFTSDSLIGDRIMIRALYYVVKHNEEWKISYEGKHYGPYANRPQAMQEAVNAAHRSGSHGYAAEVLSLGQNYTFRTEWTYGRDP
jgi:hypothetical protein